MADDLADLARRCVEVRILHRFAGDPAAKVEHIGAKGVAWKTVPGDEHFTILVRRGPWDGAALRGDGKTIEEAMRNLHDE